MKRRDTDEGMEHGYGNTDVLLVYAPPLPILFFVFIFFSSSAFLYFHDAFIC